MGQEAVARALELHDKKVAARDAKQPQPSEQNHVDESQLKKQRDAEAEELERVKEMLAKPDLKTGPHVLQFSSASNEALSINVEGKTGWHVGQKSSGCHIRAAALTSAPDGLVVVWSGTRMNEPGQASKLTHGVYRTWFPAHLLKNVKLVE